MGFISRSGGMGWPLWLLASRPLRPGNCVFGCANPTPTPYGTHCGEKGEDRVQGQIELEMRRGCGKN